MYVCMYIYIYIYIRYGSVDIVPCEPQVLDKRVHSELL